MKVFRRLSQNIISPSALAIGNFDGVHRGHQALLSKLKEVASRLGVLPTVLTFNPHPRRFFAELSGNTETVPFTITPFRDKMRALAGAGVKQVCMAPFDAALASLSAEAFIEQVLVGALRVRWMTVGENFRFGRGREGTTELLVDAGKRYHFEVAVMPMVNDGEDRISSTDIRHALALGELDRAAKLLGRPYTLSGHVVKGNRLGRELGFPTANLSLRQGLPVLSGVFITRVHGLEPEPLPAVSMIGSRPTVVEQGAVVLETHLLDYQSDIYGTLIEIEFLEKLRDNRRFSGVDALKMAIRNDIAVAKIYFRQHHTGMVLHR
jgi:riboflavin kinase/FMN adenylyltransferase